MEARGMTESRTILSAQAQAVCAALGATCAKLDAQGCDKRAVVIGMTSYLGSLIRTVAEPRVVLPLVREVQDILAEYALEGVEGAGHG